MSVTPGISWLPTFSFQYPMTKKTSLSGVISRRKATWKESYDKPKQHIKKQKHHFADKGPHNQCYGCSSSHVWMQELDHKEGWVPKNWCFWTVVLEKTLESPLDSKEIKPVNLKGNQPWLFTGRTDAGAETTILWPSDTKNRLLTLGKRRAGGEGGDREWDGWMASLTQWTWTWATSRRWWRTGKPGVLQSMGSKSQTQLCDWTTIDLFVTHFVLNCLIFSY